MWVNWRVKKNLFFHVWPYGKHHQRVCFWRFHPASSSVYMFCRSDEAVRDCSCWSSRTWCWWNCSEDIFAAVLVELQDDEFLYFPLSSLDHVPYLRVDGDNFGCIYIFVCTMKWLVAWIRNKSVSPRVQCVYSCQKRRRWLHDGAWFLLPPQNEAKKQRSKSEKMNLNVMRYLKLGVGINWGGSC